MTWEPLTLESQTATQEEIERITGLNRATFRASSFIAAGINFCELQPREQKRILGELLQLGQWDEWRDRAASERRSTESELDRLAGGLERAEQELAGRAQVEQELATARERERETKAFLDAALSRLATAREALAEARAKAERRAGAEKAVQQADQAVSDLQAGIAAREASIGQNDLRLAEREGLAVLVEGLPGLERERDKLAEQAEGFAERERLVVERDRLAAEGQQSRAKADDLMARAIAVQDGHVDLCDRCGQTLPDDAAKRAADSYSTEAIEHSLRATKIEEHDLPILNEKISALPTEPPDRERAAHVHDLIHQGQNAQQRLAALDEVASQREQAVRELEEMRAGLPERESVAAAAHAQLEALGPHDPDEAQHAEFALDMIQSQANELSNERETAVREKSRCQTRLERLDQIAAEAKTARDRRDSLHADLDLYTRMEKACGPNGVPALILEQMAIPQIETEADEILRRFGSKAIGVQLLTQREKKDGGLADTLQVNVLTEYGSRDYRTFSTGERLRVNAAITLAIAKLVAARSAQTGLLVIDDLGPLDAQGMAVLAEICNELAGTIRSVFVISQSPELRDAFEQSLTIESIDGKSRIVGA